MRVLVNQWGLFKLTTMNKTAMQRMLDDLLAKREVYENAKMYECVATLETSIEIAEFLLEKEKEQIQVSFLDGQETPINHPNLPHYSKEEYYNDNYNQNK